MAAISTASPRTAVPAVTAFSSASQFGIASLYVGDLEANVNEAQLYELFSQVGQVLSVRVCRDYSRRSSLGYAYVNFSIPHDAANAREHLNYTFLNGKAIRIMFSHRDPSIRKSGYANVFIKNLDTSIDNKALHDTFASFGTVLSSKVAVDLNGQSKGYGFVQFDNEESAQNAIKQLNGMLINDKKVYVGLFVRRQERAQANGSGSPKFTNVYVKNFSETYADGDLVNLFSTYGTITSAVVLKDTDGKSRCFGFVNFASPDSAAAAVEKLNGTTIDDDKALYVGRAQRKAEREAALKKKFEQEKLRKYEKLQAANLYLKNLDDSINDEKLKELFSEFGTITSCKVMVDMNGHSKGSGFVAFSTPEEANKALNKMSGKMIRKKPLYVAVAQRKEDRKACLQVQFSQVQVPDGITALSSGIPGYYPGTGYLSPRYFGQGTTAFLPPQPPAYGFQQPFLSGMGAGVGVASNNFMMPNHQRQHGSGFSGRARFGNNSQRTRPTQPLLHHRNSNGFRYNNRNSVNQSLPFDGPAVPVDNLSPGAFSDTLASTLASATQENQLLMLGQRLYPLVDRITPSNQTAKVTGMLLEMDQSEVIHLIESYEDLKIKVHEAMQVLHGAASGSEVGA